MKALEERAVKKKEKNKKLVMYMDSLKAENCRLKMQNVVTRLVIFSLVFFVIVAHVLR